MKQETTGMERKIARLAAVVKKMESRLEEVEDSILTQDDIRSLEQADRDLAEGRTVSHEEVGRILRER